MPCDVARTSPRVLLPAIDWRSFDSFRVTAAPYLTNLTYLLQDRVGSSYTIPAKIRGAPTGSAHPWDETDGDGTIISGDAGGRNSDNVATATERNGVVGTWTDKIVQMEIMFSELGTGPVARFTAPVSAAGGTPPAPILLQNNTTTIDAAGSTFINITNTNGTNNIFQFVDNGNGGNFQFVTPPTTGFVPRWDGTNIVYAAPTITIENNNSVVNANGTSILNFGDTYYTTTDDGSGQVSVTPSETSAGSDLKIEKLVKLTQDGTVTIYSGDLRGRELWVSVDATDDPNPENNQWGAPGGMANFKFGTNYSGGDVALYGGAVGSGRADVYFKSGTGNITVVASGGTPNPWTDHGYYHVKIQAGPVKAAASPDHTI